MQYYTFHRKNSCTAHIVEISGSTVVKRSLLGRVLLTDWFTWLSKLYQVFNVDIVEVENVQRATTVFDLDKMNSK